MRSNRLTQAVEIEQVVAFFGGPKETVAWLYEQGWIRSNDNALTIYDEITGNRLRLMSCQEMNFVEQQIGDPKRAVAWSFEYSSLDIMAALNQYERYINEGRRIVPLQRECQKITAH